MKKVYQTIIDQNKGNCMQAAIASLFDLELEEVPDFKQFGAEWHEPFLDFINSQGYKFLGTMYNHNRMKLEEGPEYIVKGKNRLPTLKDEKYKGVNGFFYAAVFSPKYYERGDKSPTTHAVLIDNNCNIVHDPNPENQELEGYPETDFLGHNGILHIFLIEPKETEDE